MVLVYLVSKLSIAAKSPRSETDHLRVIEQLTPRGQGPIAMGTNSCDTEKCVESYESAMDEDL